MVLHLSTFHLEGGAGVAATRLHRALLNAGEESYMLIPSVRQPERGVAGFANTPFHQKKAWMRFVAERLYFYPEEKDSTIRFAFSPARAGADISKHPLVRRADVIHIHWINFGFLSMDSLDKLFALKKPIVWTLHDMWTFTGGCHYSRGCQRYLSHCQYCPYLAKPSEYDIAFQQFEQKRILYGRSGLALVSPSRWLDSLVKQAALTMKTASQSIPNCLDTNIFTPGNTLLIRKKLNLPVNKKLMLFAGANTLDPRKGFNYFKDAITLARQQVPEIEVLILGKSKNNNFDFVPAPVHALGIISSAEGMAEAYQAADLIVVPSLEDNLPNTIMEAMACGTPAVGFKTGGIPELIDHKENGYVSDFGSAESLAAGIRWVLENNADGALSNKARTKVLEHYSESVVASRYKILYDSFKNE